MAALALPRVEEENGRFYRAKLDTARFFMDRLLPQSGALFSSIMAGGESTMKFDDEAF